MILSHMFFQKKLQKGFSTPEVVLSIFIVSVGMMAIMALMTSSLRYSYQSQDVIIATALAQEGLELVRNIRDNDFADGGTGFPASMFDRRDRYCRTDWDDTQVWCRRADWNNVTTPTRYDLQLATGLYDHGGVGQGQGEYSRYLYIEYDDTAGQENALVRSFVVWGGGLVPPDDGNSSQCTTANSCVFLETTLTSWK